MCIVVRGVGYSIRGELGGFRVIKNADSVEVAAVAVDKGSKRLLCTYVHEELTKPLFLSYEEWKDDPVSELAAWILETYVSA